MSGALNERVHFLPAPGWSLTHEAASHPQATLVFSEVEVAHSTNQQLWQLAAWVLIESRGKSQHKHPLKVFLCVYWFEWHYIPNKMLLQCNSKNGNYREYMRKKTCGRRSVSLVQSCTLSFNSHLTWETCVASSKKRFISSSP